MGLGRAEETFHLAVDQLSVQLKGLGKPHVQFGTLTIFLWSMSSTELMMYML
jgi:hypothetical protein